MDETLIAQGEDVSNPNLRYVLASRIFSSTVQPKRKDNRLKEGTGLLAVMQVYNITDAASYAEAVKAVNSKFYALRSRKRENQDLSAELSVRIDCYEDWKRYQKHYRTLEKLPETKRSRFERRYEHELRHYRQAVTALRRGHDDGEKLDCKAWKKALEHLNKERFMLDYQLQEQKEEVRRLEVVKRELIRENKQERPVRFTPF